MAATDVIFDLIWQTQTFLMYTWPFIILIFVVIAKIKWKNWPIEAVIIEKRGNNLIKTNDRAGRRTDAYTGLTSYRLQKSKDSVPIINYDWVLVNVVVHNTILERLINLLRGNVGTIFLFRYGSKQYKPIHIKQNNQVKTFLKEMKNKDGSPTIIRLYEQFDPRKHLGVLDFDVVDWDNMNFMVQEQRATFERRRKKKEFLYQILIPITMMVIAALVIIVMFKYSYDYAIQLKSSAPPSSTPATSPDIPIISDIVPAG